MAGYLRKINNFALQAPFFSGIKIIRNNWRSDVKEKKRLFGHCVFHEKPL